MRQAALLLLLAGSMASAHSQPAIGGPAVKVKPGTVILDKDAIGEYLAKTKPAVVPRDLEAIRGLEAAVTPRAVAKLKGLRDCSMCIPAPSTPAPGSGFKDAQLPPSVQRKPVPSKVPEDGGEVEVGPPGEEGRLGFRTDPLGFLDVVRVFVVKGIEAKKETCTGVRFAPGWVLTAAHCVPDDKARQDGWTPVVMVPRWDYGTLKACTDAAKAGTERPCVAFDRHATQGFERHPSYEAASGTTPPKFDLALIAMSEEVAPARRWARIDFVPDRPQHITLAGYGTTFTSSERGDRLEVGYRFDVEWSASTFKVVDLESSGACHGDSGGPVFRGLVRGKVNEDHRLVGLVSFGKPLQSTDQCTPPYVVGMTSVADESVRKWLCSSVKDLC